MNSIRCLFGLVFVFIWKHGLSEEVDILKELQLVNARLKDIMVENESLKERTSNLERVTSEILTKNAILEKRTSELETIAREISNENVLLRKRIRVFERSAKSAFLEIIELRKTKLMDMDKVSTGCKQDLITEVKNVDKYADNSDKEDNSKKILNADSTLSVSTENSFPSNRNRRLLLPSVTVAPIVTDRHVSFFARIKTNIANVGDNQEIPFETVITDTHQAFHAGTGLFTCPQTGVYAFTATILTYPNIWVQFNIVKDGTLFAFGYSYGDATRYGTGSTFGIVQLQKGDKVWVKIAGTAHSTGTGLAIIQDYSSFSGFSLSFDP